MDLTHALFLGDQFLGEVKPDALNVYSAERLVALPSTYWTAGYRWGWQGRTPVEDAAAVQVDQITAVKAEAERRKMKLLSAGGAKKAEYAEKRAEVLAWDTLGGTAAAILLAFNGLSALVRQTRFAHALADSAAFGDTPADAIARFRAGITKAVTIPAICAAEAKACAAIKAASTASDKRRVAASVSWPS